MLSDAGGLAHLALRVGWICGDGFKYPRFREGIIFRMRVLHARKEKTMPRKMAR